MALRACENPCSFTNLYSRPAKILLRLRNENVTRLIIEGRNTTPTNDVDKSRRKLFCSPVIQKTNSIGSVSSLSGSHELSQKSKQPSFDDGLIH